MGQHQRVIIWFIYINAERVTTLKTTPDNTCLSSDMFTGLTRLKKSQLHAKKIRGLLTGVFSDLIELEE